MIGGIKNIMGIRFTMDVIEKVLNKNEGFTNRTYHKTMNYEEENIYSIVGGKLLKRSIGKISGLDNRYDKTSECDIDQTRRFLRNQKHMLNLNI